MTTGSGNGWPDVVKVPAQKTEHDPMCPTNQNLDPACWFCDLIAKVRDDEQDKRFDKIAALLERWNDLRAKVEALTPIGVVHPYGLDSFVPATLISRADVLALFDGSSE